MRVQELMRAHVVSVTATDTLAHVVETMDLYQATLVPVVDDDDRLVGVVTEHDVACMLLPGAARGPCDASLVSVSEVMTAPAIHVMAEDDVLGAADLMLHRCIKRLPVTSGGRLVGILSRIDICRAVMDGQPAP